MPETEFGSLTMLKLPGDEFVSLEPVSEGTRMTFDLRGVDGTKGDGSFHDGWVEALDSLEGHLTKAPTA